MVTKEQWKKLAEKDKKILAELDYNSPEDLNKAAWKVFDSKKDIHERIHFVNLKNTKLLEEFYQLDYLCIPENYKLLSEEHKKQLDAFRNGEMFEILPDEKWESLYHNGFLHSNEWKRFTISFISRYPKCNRCSKAAKIPHHIAPAQKTALREGFLKPLQNDKNFEPLCTDCHAKEEGIIS